MVLFLSTWMKMWTKICSFYYKISFDCFYFFFLNDSIRIFYFIPEYNQGWKECRWKSGVVHWEEDIINTTFLLIFCHRKVRWDIWVLSSDIWKQQADAHNEVAHPEVHTGKGRLISVSACLFPVITNRA